MAWPTGNAIDAVVQFDRTAAAIKKILDARITSWALNDVTSSEVIGLWNSLKAHMQTMKSSAQVKGVAEMAKIVKGDNALDVAGEYQGLASAVASLISSIQSSFPVSGGYLQERSFIDGEIVDRTFTPVQTANIRLKMQAVSDLIS